MQVKYNTERSNSRTRAFEKLWFMVRHQSEGGTVRTTEEWLPTQGYFVGGASYTLVGAPETLTYDALKGFWDAHPQAEYFGWWVNSITGRTFVDVTTWHANLNDALVNGRLRGELAVWDIVNASEVRIDRSDPPDGSERHGQFLDSL